MPPIPHHPTIRWETGATVKIIEGEAKGEIGVIVGVHQASGDITIDLKKGGTVHKAPDQIKNAHGAFGEAFVQGGVEKFAVSGSRFTQLTADRVRAALADKSDAQINKWLGELGEPESPSEARQPKIERLVWGWLDGRLRNLAIELGLEPTESDLRKRYGA